MVKVIWRKLLFWKFLTLVCAVCICSGSYERDHSAKGILPAVSVNDIVNVIDQRCILIINSGAIRNSAKSIAAIIGGLLISNEYVNKSVYLGYSDFANLFLSIDTDTVKFNIDGTDLNSRTGALHAVGAAVLILKYVYCTVHPYVDYIFKSLSIFAGGCVRACACLFVVTLLAALTNFAFQKQFSETFLKDLP